MFCGEKGIKRYHDKAYKKAVINKILELLWIWVSEKFIIAFLIGRSVIY